MSIFDKQQDLENLPDQALVQLGQQPSPQYPSYLVMAEVERRRDMRQRHEAEMAKHQAANPPDIATQRMDELGGIAGVDPAMGQGPPPEEMAALQGGIAGGPPPGMEQMGGPPPGMEGQPPMMAYGGLIPGYQDGGLHPDPDEEDGFLRRLWSERMRPALEEDLENIRDFPSRTIFTEEGRRIDPEMDWETRDVLGGPGAMEAFGPAAFGKGIMSLRGAWPRVRGAVSSRLPGATRRAAREAVETARAGVGSATTAKATRAAEDVLRAAEQALEGTGGWLSRLRPGSSVIQGLERQVTFATKAADDAAAVTGALKDGKFAKNLAGQLAERTAAARDAAIKALEETADPRGLTHKLLDGLPGLLWRNKKKTAAGTAVGLEWLGSDSDRAAGGLIPGYQEGAIYSGPDEDDEDPDRGWLLDKWANIKHGLGDVAAFPIRAYDRAVPADWDVWGEEWAESPERRFRFEGTEEPSEAARARAEQVLDSATPADPEGSDAGTEEDVLAYLRGRDADQARRRAEDRALAELRLTQGQDLTDTFLSRLQTPSDEQIERRKLWADEADDEAALLARELGLSTERVDELRREMRTEKETDHARKARLFSGLGAALMGSPRGLGSALQSTTTGLEDLDEKLRVERRRDLGDVYTQRAKGISAERSGRAGIRSLRDKRYADIIAQETAGEGPAYQAMMDMYGRQMAADTQRYGSRLSMEAQMLNQKLTMGRVEPQLWAEWESLFDDQIRALSEDPGSRHYDLDEAERLEDLKVRMGTLLLDTGAANVGAGGDLGLVPESLQYSR